MDLIGNPDYIYTLSHVAHVHDNDLDGRSDRQHVTANGADGLHKDDGVSFDDGHHNSDTL